jgi:hypothetical protein
MLALSVSGLISYSNAPDKLAAFLRDTVGIPLEMHAHGDIKQHAEGTFQDIHFAVWGGQPKVVPVFRVASLEEATRTAEKAGARALHPPLDLGKGLRVTSFEAPGGIEVRFIEVRG